MNSRQTIISGHCGDVVWLRIEGAGCRENSADVARALQMDIVHGKESYVIDLDECTGLDSTFMGMLIGLAKQIRQEAHGSLHLINAHGRNAQLLRGLGVHYFCNVTEDAGDFGAECNCCETRSDVVLDHELEHCSLSKREFTEHCLEAHTRLCETGKANQEKFQTVVDLMEQKLVQLSQ